MLLSFCFKNYLSFKNLTTVHLSGAHSGSVYCLYGKPASGKTNWVRALLFMGNYYLHVSQNPLLAREILHPFWADEQAMFNQSLFQITFKSQNEVYRYGFTLTTQKVFSEWLYVSRYNDEEALIFSRCNDQTNWGIKQPDDTKLSLTLAQNPTFLLLPLLQTQPFLPAQIMGNLFTSQLLVVLGNPHSDKTDYQTAKQLLLVPAYKKWVLTLLQHIDPTITNIVPATHAGASAHAADAKHGYAEPVINRNSMLTLLHQANDPTGFIAVLRRYKTPSGELLPLYFNAELEEGATIKSVLNYGFLLAHIWRHGGAFVIDMPEKTWGWQLTLKIAQLFTRRKPHLPPASLVFTASMPIKLPGTTLLAVVKNQHGVSDINQMP